MPGMNKLPTAKRTQILSMLCEGSSMQAAAWDCDVAFNSVVKLHEDAGRVCEVLIDAREEAKRAALVTKRSN